MLLSGAGSFHFRKFREDGFFAPKLKQGAISRLFVFAESALPRKVQLPFMFVYHSIKRVVVFLLLRIQNVRGKIKPQFFLIKSSVFSAMSLIDTLL